jgi:HD-GYP domain-containing protein (c-di-GMP phosphodiesterase class II)
VATPTANDRTHRPLPRPGEQVVDFSRPHATDLPRLLIAATTFFAAAYYSFHFARATQSIAIIWPAVGISLAFTWLWGRRIIPATLVADYAATALFAPQATAVLFACGNALALFAAYWLMARNRVAREFYLLPRDMFLFLGATLVLSCVSAAWGTGVEYYLAGLPEADILRIWWLWFIGDFTGVVFLAPLAVSLAVRGVQGIQKNLAQPLAIFACIIATSAVFLANTSFFSEGYPVPFLIMPFLVWAAFTMSYREFYAFLFTLSCIAVFTTYAGYGLFSIYSHVQSLLLLQAYMVISALMVLTLHCIVSSRKTAFLAATRNRDALIFSLADLAEMRDSQTGAHLMRTQQYVRVLAEKMSDLGLYRDQLGEEAIDLITKTAPLHDIGKVGVPDAILNKAGRLTPEEFEEIKKHPENGSMILTRAKRFLGGGRFLDVARDIVLHHHERWDGSGYPHGLAGRDIPLPARLMALADVYDALTSPRVYKSAMPHPEAREVIIQGRGGHFDPDIVDAFLHVEPRFQGIAARTDEAGEA